MIIASKGSVRMKGDSADVMAEFITIVWALMEEEEIPCELLKDAIDLAESSREKDPKKTP